MKSSNTIIVADSTEMVDELKQARKKKLKKSVEKTLGGGEAQWRGNNIVRGVIYRGGQILIEPTKIVTSVEELCDLIIVIDILKQHGGCRGGHTDLDEHGKGSRKWNQAHALVIDAKAGTRLPWMQKRVDNKNWFNYCNRNQAY